MSLLPSNPSLSSATLVLSRANSVIQCLHEAEVVRAMGTVGLGWEKQGMVL